MPGWASVLFAQRGTMTATTLLLPSDRKTSVAGFASLAVLACALAPALTRTIPALPQSAAAKAAVPAAQLAAGPATTATTAVAAAAAKMAKPAIHFEPAPTGVFKAPPAERQPAPMVASASYYEQLRAKLRWVPVKVGDQRLRTPDLGSRLLLVRSAAKRAGLHEVGLNHRDIYGIINAETSWIPRTGASKDGTPNLGIAQFEPATARALGLRNPNDPVESIHVAALHLKEAAEWSARRIAPLNLSPQQHAVKLREGISIYYNLSSKGRARWNGKNTDELPRETQLHISNARKGMIHVASIEEQLRKVRAMTQVKAEGTVAQNGKASGI
jgi:hypothetical protein